MDARSDSRVKHIDFIIIDLLCVEISFVLAIITRYGLADFVSILTNSANDDYRAFRLVNVVLVLAYLVFMLFTGPHTGIVKRGHLKEFWNVFIINAEIVKELMSLKGASVDHAENGRIAVEMLEKSDPGYYDAILMDVRMPEMDGLEATRAIRALQRPDAKDIPIIAMTANAFDEDVQRSLQAGMNAHLSKPVEAEHLYKTLEELIWEKDNKTE